MSLSKKNYFFFLAGAFFGAFAGAFAGFFAGFFFAMMHHLLYGSLEPRIVCTFINSFVSKTAKNRAIYVDCDLLHEHD